MSDNKLMIDPDEVRALVREAVSKLPLHDLVLNAYRNAQREESVRQRAASEMTSQERAEREMAARIAKEVLMAEAARHGPIQLRFNSIAAPEALQWLPVLPNDAWRR